MKTSTNLLVSSIFQKNMFLFRFLKIFQKVRFREKNWKKRQIILILLNKNLIQLIPKIEKLMVPQFASDIKNTSSSHE